MARQDNFRIVFEGRVADGEDIDAVKARLGERFTCDPARIEKLFDGSTHVLKQVGSITEATRYLTLLRQTGAVARILDAEGRDVTPRPETGAKERPRARPLTRGWFFALTLPPITALVLLVFALYFTVIALLTTGTLYWAMAGDELAAAVVPWFPLNSLVHAVLLLFGTLLTFLAIKPLLPARKTDAYDLERGEAPDLYDYLDHVLQAIGAPPVARIALTHRVEISASPRGGLLGLLSPHLDLRLGLPLIADLEVAQLAGLAAREGHTFRRGFGSLCRRLLCGLDAYLSCAASADDRLDSRLMEWQPQRAFSRRIKTRLRTLFATSKHIPLGVRAITRMLARRHQATLVLQADRAQRRVAGSETFEQTLARECLLAFSANQLGTQAGRWQRAGWYPDNLAATTARLAEELPAAKRHQLLDRHEQNQRRQSPLPSDGERREAAERAGPADGLCHCQQPARELLGNFRHLDQRLSLRYLRNSARLPATPDRMRPFSRLEQPYAPSDRDQRLVEDYFGGIFLPYLQLKPVMDPDWDEAPYVIAAWQEATSGMQSLSRRAHEDLTNYRHAESRFHLSHIAAQLLEAGLRLPADQLGLSVADADDAHAACRLAENEQDTALGVLMPYTRRVMTRLSAALALLQLPEATTRLKEAKALSRHAAGLLTILDGLATIGPQLNRLRQHLYALDVLLSTPSGRHAPRLQDRIAEQQADIDQWLTSIRALLKTVDLASGTGARSLLKRVFKDAPEEAAPKTCLERSEIVFERLQRLQYHLLGQAISLARQAEQAWRLGD